MAKKRIFLINEYERRVKGNVVLAGPNEVIEVDSDTADRLKNLGAARDANEAENALYEKGAASRDTADVAADDAQANVENKDAQKAGGKASGSRKTDDI